jgi:Cdc6-like AAA superfamily ATPase
MKTANVIISFDKAAGKFKCSINGQKFTTTKQAYIEYQFKQITGEKKSFKEIEAMQKPAVSEKFGINERFGFVEKLVNMVSSGVQPSAVITGQGGLGKTYTVMKTLQNAGIQDYNEVVAKLPVGARVNMSKLYVTIKGYSTPKGLYRTLFENNNATIVFDDCDSILKDPVALNLLKGALDSYGKRIISWNAEGFGKDDELPRSFEFKGRVIFISNMDQDNIDQAIRSRSMMIDLSMTDDQKIDRMEHISKSEEFLPEYDASIKADALSLIRTLKGEAKEISLRTLISVCKIRAANPVDYKDLATYVLCN